MQWSVNKKNWTEGSIRRFLLEWIIPTNKSASQYFLPTTGLYRMSELTQLLAGSVSSGLLHVACVLATIFLPVLRDITYYSAVLAAGFARHTDIPVYAFSDDWPGFVMV